MSDFGSNTNLCLCDDESVCVNIINTVSSYNKSEEDSVSWLLKLGAGPYRGSVK
jgi:hypothetical protein